MGYSCKIKTDKELSLEAIQSIVNGLPYDYKRDDGFSVRQSWGWHLACDLYLPEGNTITIGGSHSISGGIAKGFTDHLLRKLEELDYQIEEVKWSQ